MNAARALLWLAFCLALVVVGASSGLRLAANGLGCEPWPSCYGSPAAAAAVKQSATAQAARLTHRVAASAFVIAVLGGVLLGWRAWRKPARVAALFVLGVAGLLAIIGRYTPSMLPAVTLVNVIGGMALLGGVAFLLAAGPDGDARRRPSRRWLYALLLLALVQAAGGVMISVRSAGSACADGCDAQSMTDVLPLWNPIASGSAEAIRPGPGAGSALHQAHRLFATVVAMVAVAVVAAAPRRQRGRGLLLGALAGCVLLGLALAVFDGSLGLAVAHALGAGALVAALAVLLPVGRARKTT